jgi:UDP-glucose 4-epimerase
MAVLISGAAGFLGQQVVHCAQRAGLRVRATDRRRGGLPADLDFRPADIAAPKTLHGLFDGMDCVLHVAGLAHVFGKSQAAAAPFHNVNALGTAHVARAAAEAGVGAMVLVSSVSVYGRHEKQLVDETCPCAPESPYADSKYQAEQLATEIAQATGMRLTILRLATLYGEGDPGNVARLFRAIDRQRFVWIGDGSNQKSLLHRDDAARACVAAAIQPAAEVRTCNVAAPPCSMREIVETIAKALSRKLPTWRVPVAVAMSLGRMAGILTLGHTRLGSLPGTLRKWLADDAYSAERFETEFGFRTQVSLAEGICREAAWYRAPR